MSRAAEGWSRIGNAEEVASPALLVYPDRIERNIRAMVRIAGGPERLRPHVKTHKMAEIVRLQQDAGIDRFKCATLAEAEMLARCAVRHALLALQPVGPNGARLAGLARIFPQTRFGAIVDHPDSARALARAAQDGQVTLDALVDLDCGMGRTGIAPGPEAFELYRLICGLPGLTAGGLHAYDGQIHDRDPAERRRRVEAAMAPVRTLREHLEKAGLPVPRLVAGGTPTLAAHAAVGDRECSPGTCVLWDAGYARLFPDLDFQPAAALLTR
ncbi:MAG: alanine racemase, partial [Opitutaceae bacterium]